VSAFAPDTLRIPGQKFADPSQLVLGELLSRINVGKPAHGQVARGTVGNAEPSPHRQVVNGRVHYGRPRSVLLVGGKERLGGRDPFGLGSEDQFLVHKGRLDFVELRSRALGEQLIESAAPFFHLVDRRVFHRGKGAKPIQKASGARGCSSRAQPYQKGTGLLGIVLGANK